MSDLDKEAVLDEFTAAYKKAHGKKPKVEDSNGWYSVDGGKNMRLAQLDEWTQELNSGKSAKATSAKTKSTDTKKAASKKASSKTGTTKKAAAKSSGAKKTKKQVKTTPKKSTASKPKAKTSKAKQDTGHTPTQAWQAYLDQQAGQSRYPRGFKSE